mmetsp:Transcript_104232/g.270129  ORF Transcript_104232/g.270129 Transcript_104232/m.270129 type:complete len:280 (-) Transcript_104232:708-1547(-)
MRVGRAIPLLHCLVERFNQASPEIISARVEPCIPPHEVQIIVLRRLRPGSVALAQALHVWRHLLSATSSNASAPAKPSQALQKHRNQRWILIQMPLRCEALLQLTLVIIPIESICWQRWSSELDPFEEQIQLPFILLLQPGDFFLSRGFLQHLPHVGSLQRSSDLLHEEGLAGAPLSVDPKDTWGGDHFQNKLGQSISVVCRADEVHARLIILQRTDSIRANSCPLRSVDWCLARRVLRLHRLSRSNILLPRRVLFFQMGGITFDCLHSGNTQWHGHNQ